MDLETGEKHFYIFIEKLQIIKNNSKQFIAAGTLVEQKKYGKQENKKIVITIDDQTEIEVNLSSVCEISEDEYFLLVAVSSKEKCLKAFNNRENLRLAISAKGGTNVEVITEFDTITGMLIYKGPIDRHCGTYFGVLFKVPYGNCNGLPHFTCEINHGIYVAIDQISFCETNKNPLSKLKPMKKHKNEQKEVHLVSADNKFIGMRVLCNVSGQNNLLKGSIRYIGYSKSQPFSGYHPPPNKLRDKYIGNMKGIQGHINSCYIDATLFAIFAFNSTFDFILYQKSCKDDIGDKVQKCLHLNIVNPLRVNGFVKQPCIMELRKCLDNNGEIASFIDKEKDPVEFLTKLFEVLRIKHFMILSSLNQDNIGVYFYQIIADINLCNPQPSIQYLIEMSFISKNTYLFKVPSVMIIQVPCFRQNKIFNRIQVTPTLDLNPFLLDAHHLCIICGDSSSCYCKNCMCEFSWKNVYTYFCKKCWDIFHKHHKRHDHEMVELSSFLSNPSEPFLSNSTAFTTMELFAVVCIKTSHYVSFVKCGEGDEASWVFFDSMADISGDHNIPEVVEVPKLNDFLMSSPLDISSIKEDEYALMLCEDASLCFYRNTQMSMYT